MPPVLGPSSPSQTRLKSCAGGRATTVRAVGEAEHGDLGAVEVLLDDDAAARRRSRRAACVQGLVAVVGDDDALAGGESVVLDDVGRAEGRRARRRLPRASVQTWAIAVGTPAAAMTSLANALLPSSWAAAADGPKTGKPAARRRRPRRRRAGPRGRRRRGRRRAAVARASDRVGVGDVGQRLATGDRVDARVAGGGDDGVDRVVRRERPGEGVLTGTGAEDEDYPAGHDDHPRANAAERQPAVRGTEPPGLRPLGPNCEGGARGGTWGGATARGPGAERRGAVLPVEPGAARPG